MEFTPSNETPPMASIRRGFCISPAPVLEDGPELQGLYARCPLLARWFRS